MQQGGLTHEGLLELAHEVRGFLSLLQTHKEVLCRVEDDKRYYFLPLKPEALQKAADAATQLLLAHGGSEIRNVTHHWMDYNRCFCGCPNSHKDKGPDEKLCSSCSGTGKVKA